MKPLIKITIAFYSILLSIVWAILFNTVQLGTFQLRWLIGIAFLLYFPYIYYRRVHTEIKDKNNRLLALILVYGSIIFGYLGTLLGPTLPHKIVYAAIIAIIVNLIAYFYLISKEKRNHAS